MRKYKLRVYLSSGQTMIVRCNYYKFEWDQQNNRYKSWHFIGASPVGIDPGAIVAWEEL